MCHGRTLVAIVVSMLVVGCAERPFRFCEDSAMQRLMATEHVAGLRRAIPFRRLMCMVDYTMPDTIYLYLGDDEGDHTTRVGFYRVTQDGRVWMNLDETGFEDRWAPVK